MGCTIPDAPSNGVVRSSAFNPSKSNPLVYVSSHSDLDSKSSSYKPRRSEDISPRTPSSKYSAKLASNGMSSGISIGISSIDWTIAPPMPSSITSAPLGNSIGTSIGTSMSGDITISNTPVYEVSTHPLGHLRRPDR